MPLLRIQTNAAVDNERRDALLSRASQQVAEQLGKPERYVMVALESERDMLFAGSGEPLAFLELKSIGLPESATAELSRCLCALMTEQLGIEAGRVYIEFTDAPRRMWGWNAGTF